MMPDQIQIRTEFDPGNEKGEKPPPRYHIDRKAADAGGRALAVLVAGRRCYMCRQGDVEEPSASQDMQPYARCIAEHCGQMPDYLPSDTPLKEAIFRVILAGENEPMAAEEISQVLLERWAMTPFPRDISPRVIGRLMDHSESYCIARVPEPGGDSEQGGKLQVVR